MRVLDLLRQVYREIGALESSRRQKDMIIADNAGVKAIRYDKDKVSGGQQGDLADALLNIEREQERINEQIARQPREGDGKFTSRHAKSTEASEACTLI